MPDHVLKDKQELDRKREEKRPIQARRVVWTKNQDERQPCAENQQTCLPCLCFFNEPLPFCRAEPFRLAPLLFWSPLESLAGARCLLTPTCGHLLQSTAASAPFRHHSQDTQRHRCRSVMGRERRKKALPLYHGLL